MSLNDFAIDETEDETEEEKGYVTIKKPVFYGLIGVLLALVLIIGIGSFAGYATITSPKTACSYVLYYHLGDDDALDGCSYKLAKEYQDITYCNSIINPELQKECVKVVSLSTSAY